MKISYNWLKQYLQIDHDPKTVAEVLTSTGLEVEDIIPFESVKGGLQGVVTAEVIACEKHPNADKLSLTKVDTGAGEPLSIVCGAPNVATGQKVLVATVGTMIHMGDKSFEIKKTQIRGAESAGMICAEDELGLGNSHDGIMVLPHDVPVGMKASEYFQIETDTVFEIGLTPNRSDATSHIGVARDLAAALNVREGKKKYKLTIPLVDEFRVESNKLDIDVVVEDVNACPRYSGLTITGLKVGDSPAWLKNKLSAIGVRPINNIVDITNFILFETGQPLHAFDAAAVSGNKVVVKTMAENTPFVTLDEVERKLSPSDLMICNATEAMCIGGVFGGLRSGVTDSTTAIFLESACFDSKSIRRTSKFHGLQTDASFRFERGSDPNITVYALKRAAMLITDLAGGHISSGIKDVYPNPVQPFEVRLNYNYLNKLIGQSIPEDLVNSILVDLQVDVISADQDGLVLKVPPFKTDVSRPADIVEEVLRIYGYDNIRIPEKLNASINSNGGQDAERLQNMIAEMLTANGFYEIMNNSLTRSAHSQRFAFIQEEENVVILNPLSTDLDVLRQNLLFGGLECLAYNQNRKNNDLKFYEFGNVYRFGKEKNEKLNPLAAYHEEKHLDFFMMGNKHQEIWNKPSEGVDFYDLKFAIEAVLKKLGIKSDNLMVELIKNDLFDFGLHYTLEGKMIGTAGKLRPELLQHFDLKKEVYYGHLNWNMLLNAADKHTILFKPVPRFPAVRRDLALVLDKHITFGELRKAAFELEPDLLLSVTIFDVYEGDKIPADKKSYAISFTLLDKEKTMTDKIIDNTMNNLLQHFQRQFAATLR